MFPGDGFGKSAVVHLRLDLERHQLLIDESSDLVAPAPRLVSGSLNVMSVFLTRRWR